MEKVCEICGFKKDEGGEIKEAVGVIGGRLFKGEICETCRVCAYCGKEFKWEMINGKVEEISGCHCWEG